MKRVTNIFACGLVLGSMVLGITGCGQEEKKVEVPKLIEPVGVDIDIAKVTKRDLSGVNSYQGQVVPDIKGAYFVNGGQVGEVKVKLGDKVKKGQLLATLTGAKTEVKEAKQAIDSQKIEDAEANQEQKGKIEQLKVELSDLKHTYKVMKSKKDKKKIKFQIVSKKEEIKTEKLKLSMQKETQNQAMKELKDEYERKKRDVKFDRLYAPASGEIIMKNLAPGDLISGGVPVINIADMNETKIRTQYIGSSKLNKASAYFATINGREYPIKVVKQDVSNFDLEMGKFPSNTYFTYEKDDNVSVGDSVSVDLLSNTTDKALTVPSNAVYKSKGENYVYVMQGNNKIKTSVKIGTKTDAYTQILSGVKEGDSVYVQN